MNTLQERLNDQNLSHFVVLEGGAAFGIGYEFGVLDELRHRGIDFSETHMLGTSAGSWVAGAIATKLTFEELADQPQIELFNQTPNYMHGYAEEIFGDSYAENVNATTTELPSLQLHIQNGGEHTLAGMAARSSAVPGVFFPATANGKLWWDGAVSRLSMGYAHEAPKANTLIVIGALARHLSVPLGPIGDIPGRVLETKSRYDWGRWQKQNPDSNVVYIRPNRAISKMVQKPQDLFDFDIARDVYWMAREQTAGFIEGPNRRDSIAALAIQNAKIPA